MLYVRGHIRVIDKPLESAMTFRPAEHLIFSTGRVVIINTHNVMLAAHEKAKREMLAFRNSRLYTADSAAYWTYARHFQEAIQWAWDRAHQAQRLAARDMKVAA